MRQVQWAGVALIPLTGNRFQRAWVVQVHARFESSGPEMHVHHADGSKTPLDRFVVCGHVKDVSGTLTPAILSHDFLVQSGAGTSS
jgi:hypothetical protein